MLNISIVSCELFVCELCGEESEFMAINTEHWPGKKYCPHCGTDEAVELVNGGH